MPRFKKGQVAESIPYDNTTSGLTAEQVQAAIDEIVISVGASASPGFNFGRSGNLPSGTWLNVTGGVPSNKAGITMALTNPEITQVFVANENVATFDIEVYEHEGDEVNLTLLGTVNIVSTRSNSFDVSYSATMGRQLAIKLVNGSAKNCNVGCQLKGTI